MMMEEEDDNAAHAQRTTPSSQRHRHHRHHRRPQRTEEEEEHARSVAAPAAGSRKRRPCSLRTTSLSTCEDPYLASHPAATFATCPGHRHVKRRRRFSLATAHARERRASLAAGSGTTRAPGLVVIERLAQQLPGLFVALDDEGRVVVWNAQCERLTGWTLAEVRSDAARLFPDADHRRRIAAEWTERRRLPLYHDWEWRVTCRDGSHRTFSWSSCHVFDSMCPWSHWAMGRDVTDEKKSRELLKEVALGFTATSADDFFQQLVQHLIAASGLDHAIVGEYQPGRHNSIRTIASCIDGQLVPNIGQYPSCEYYLEGTPCENVVKQSACTLRSCVRELFPNDRLLAELGVEGYVGRPLFSVAGKVIGLMVLMSRHAIHDAERAEMVMDIFAGRASAEFERRQHEVALKKSELLFRQVTDNIAPMVYVATPGLDEFHYVSPPFATMWGLPPERLLQEPDLWFGGIHPDDRANMRACAKLSLENDTHVCEFRVVHARTGNAKWLRDRGWKICPAVGEPRMVGIVEDISLERQTLEHLEQARQMAEEASTAKTLFLANISHEIRTPLQGILGMLELLDGAVLESTQRENLHIAKRSADHMLFLVNDLLDVVRIEKGKLEICPARFSLSEYLDFLSSSFARNADSHGIEYVGRLGHDLPDVVVGDKDRMAQVLNNIVGNAFKFTPPGGTVTLTVSRASRELVREHLPPQDKRDPNRGGGDEAQLPECVLFDIADTGIGIPQNKLPHIFDAFYQVDPAHTKKYSGLGMGLKICVELVSMMHGRIWVDSVQGQGTTFHVLLPFVQPTRAEEEERERERAEADGPGEVGNKSLDILLVEDNIVNQKVICRILSQRGYQIQVANNGVEALEKFKSPHQFDVILMDVQMPVMDGLTATIKIREMERDMSEEHIPIIGLTAGAMQEDKEKCLAAGMSHYLPKPVSRECLFAALRRWTKGPRRRPDTDDQSDGDGDDEGEPSHHPPTPPPPPRRATCRSEKRRDVSN